jgi:hypothetical protein
VSRNPFSRRHVIGLIALVLLAIGLGGWLLDDPQYKGIEGVGWRAGALMAVWWLAYKDLRRLPAWLWAAIPVAIVILVKWPQRSLVLIPVVVLALALFKPLFGGGRRPR